MIARASQAALVASLLLLGGCGYVYTDEPEPETPPPGTSAAPLPPPAASSAAAATAAGGTQVVVRAGQTLYAISREQNVPVRALIDANDLQPPYGLKIGQVLVVPRVHQYVVQPGDTLYGIARRTNVEAATLAKLNHLDPPYILKSGAPLTLPPSAAEPAQVAAAHPTAEPPPVVTEPRASAPPPSPGPAVPVAGGAIMAQSLPPPPGAKPAPAASPLPPPPGPPPAIVETAAVPLPPTKPSSPLPPPSPPAEAQPPSPPPVAVVTKPPPVPPPAPAVPEPAKPPPAKPLPPPEAEAPAAAPAAPTAVATVEDVAAAVASHRPPTAPLFYWPVRGKVLSVFGPAAGGTYNDGINIAAAEGAEIAATESGVVAYAGEMSGYGNLLLIKHADGWVSAYAHTSAFLVQKGEHVRRGQAVAKVGSSGGIGRPQLHFELRQGRTAVDPLDHLPPPGGEAG